MSQVYLIHFAQPYKHAQHYIGWTDNHLARRCNHHAHGTGARIMQVVTDAGIPWQVVRVWEDADRTFERRLKNQHKSADLCPVCNPDHWQNRMNTKEDTAMMTDDLPYDICPECGGRMIYQHTDYLGKEGYQDWRECNACGYGRYNKANTEQEDRQQL